MVDAVRQSDPNSEQSRKKSELMNLLERLLEDVEKGRMYGEFSVSFTAQSGKIGHIEELRRRTLK